ncbi:MAG: prefoldin subunit [archaeon]|nr:prefoldin subunit [archaeon]
MEIRCKDGRCHKINEGGCENIEGITCQAGLTLCESGLCKVKCPEFDGAPLGKVQCPNGLFAASDNECIGYAMSPDSSNAYRCLTGEVLSEPEKCIQIYRNANVPPITATFYLHETLEFNFAYDNTNRAIGTLHIPGSIFKMISNINYGTIKVRGVRHSTLMDYSLYNNTPLFIYNVSAGIEASDGVLGFENSVLSPVVEITSDDIEDNFESPGRIRLEFNRYTKKTAHFRYDDYCLAKLKEEGGKKHWECTARAINEETTEFPISSLGIYAVILSPSRQEEVSGTSKSFFFDNIKTLLIVFVCLVVAFAIGYYIFSRVTRYRNKYHENREKIKFLKDQKKEYENMTTDVYGQTLGDNIIGLVYTKNQAFSLDQSKMNANADLEKEIEDLNLKIKNVNRHNDRLQEQIDEMEKKFKELQTS